ncbi:hypothetical protein HDU98_002765, partial [Podochytrium sp. JEL0797]
MESFPTAMAQRMSEDEGTGSSTSITAPNKSRKSLFDEDDGNAVRGMIDRGELGTTSHDAFAALATRYRVAPQYVKTFVRNYVAKKKNLQKAARPSFDVTHSLPMLAESSPGAERPSMPTTFAPPPGFQIAGPQLTSTATPGPISLTPIVPIKVITLSNLIPTLYGAYLKVIGRRIHEEHRVAKSANPDHQPATRGKRDRFGVTKAVHDAIDDLGRTPYKRMKLAATEEDRAMLAKCEAELATLLAGHRPEEVVALSENDYRKNKLIAVENMEKAIKGMKMYDLDFFGYRCDVKA